MKYSKADFLAEMEGKQTKKNTGEVGVNCVPKTRDNKGEK